jgi:hypothetical protein
MAATFVYRCPTTGLNVQGWIADDVTDGDAEAYEAVSCPACRGMHFVNPKTSKVLGQNDR